MCKKDDSPKERLLRQFIENMPRGKINKEDLEDIQSELDFMEKEGINLNKVTLRDILKRLGI